jgi:hypothetical protein
MRVGAWPDFLRNIYPYNCIDKSKILSVPVQLLMNV